MMWVMFRSCAGCLVEIISMQKEYRAKMPEVADKIKFYIGDVRKLQSCKDAIYGVDYIFHAVALKQIPFCEFFPVEAVKTNIINIY